MSIFSNVDCDNNIIYLELGHASRCGVFQSSTYIHVLPCLNQTAFSKFGSNSRYVKLEPFQVGIVGI